MLEPGKHNLMFKLFIMCICILTFLTICGCSAAKGGDYILHGSWEKIKPDTPLGGYNISIILSEGEFRYKLRTYVDYIDNRDTCRGKHSGWVEFATGNYNLKDGRIYLIGSWTDSTFKNQKNEGCFHLGKFNESYYYMLKGNDTLILNTREAKFDDSIKYNHVYDKMTFIRK